MALFVLQLLDHILDDVLVEFIYSWVILLIVHVIHASGLAVGHRISMILMILLWCHSVGIWEGMRRHHNRRRPLSEKMSTIMEWLASKRPLADWHHTWVHVLRRMHGHGSHPIQSLRVLLLSCRSMTWSAAVLPMII